MFCLHQIKVKADVKNTPKSILSKGDTLFIYTHHLKSFNFFQNIIITSYFDVIAKLFFMIGHPYYCLKCLKFLNYYWQHLILNFIFHSRTLIVVTHRYIKNIFQKISLLVVGRYLFKVLKTDQYFLVYLYTSLLLGFMKNV